MTTRAEIQRDLRAAQSQQANMNSQLSALRRQRDQVEMLVIEIRNRRAEFVGQMDIARAKTASIGVLQTTVWTAKGYEERMNAALFGAQGNRALYSIDDMRCRAERRLAQIDAQIAQTQSSLSTLQRRISNLNYRYRVCED
jgi:predicted  nucleic acid-binding Zn-ribbon protein